MKKRVFIGIFASPELKRKIFDLKNKFKDLPVRWMRDENLHLTLLPPIYLDDKQIVEMLEKLKLLENKIGEFEIQFNRVSLGPTLRRPRLIWAEGEENQKLDGLKRQITQILDYHQDKRPFLPHLTLARFKPKNPVIINEKVDWQEVAISFSIIQSECLEKGAVYIPLATIDL